MMQPTATPPGIQFYRVKTKIHLTNLLKHQYPARPEAMNKFLWISVRSTECVVNYEGLLCKETVIL